MSLALGAIVTYCWVRSGRSTSRFMEYCRAHRPILHQQGILFLLDCHDQLLLLLVCAALVVDVIIVCKRTRNILLLMRPFSILKEGVNLVLLRRWGSIVECRPAEARARRGIVNVVGIWLGAQITIM